MKQLVLVLLIAATSLSVSAQKDYHNNNRKKDKYDRVDRYDDNKYDRFNARQKEEFRRQLERINHNYDSKIRSVSRNLWISRRNKARKINDLENERRYALMNAELNSTARWIMRKEEETTGDINR
jgi:hypothetical protein